MASGDNHWDHTSRWDEANRIHTWIAERVEAERPDVFLVPGDIYDRASVPEEREAVAAWVARVANVCPVLIAKGNHDRRLDLAILRRIRAAHPVIVEEGANVHYVGGFALMAFAWPDTAMLAAATRSDTQRGLDDEARAALQRLFRGLRAQVDLEQPDLPRVAFGHAMVDGSVTSTGQPMIGAELNVGLSDLALMGADLTVLGHIHKAQEWDLPDGPAVYTGSPYRTAFGEVEEKSIVLAEFDETGLVDWRRIPTPCADMILLESSWDGEQFDGDSLDPKWCQGAEFRFRYTVDSDHREAAREAAASVEKALLSAGALSVKLDPIVRPKSTARCAEIAKAQTLGEKLVRLWDTRGDAPDETRATRLVTMAGGVEEEIRNAA